MMFILAGSSGPCFVLDIDVYRYNTSKEEFSNAAELVDILDKLHGVVGSVFQWSVTDRMREVFRAPIQTDSDHSLPSVSNG